MVRALSGAVYVALLVFTLMFAPAFCFGVLMIDLWAAAAGFVLFYGIKALKGLRVDKRIEEEGLDIYEHGESCYN